MCSQEEGRGLIVKGGGVFSEGGCGLSQNCTLTPEKS